jgi:hypothetical protein
MCLPDSDVTVQGRDDINGPGFLALASMTTRHNRMASVQPASCPGVLQLQY